MKIEPTDIPDILLIEPKRFGDARGWFTETFRADRLEALGFTRPFVQDNHSFSAEPGTVRGLHFQIPPFAQDKLVRCTRGRMLDVAVDIRKGSPTYGRHVAIELSEENGLQLLIPAGFAHAFCTIGPDCEVQYKVTGYYSREHERSILWNDPDLGIDWGLPPEEAALSDKDRAAPRLRDCETYFTY